MRVLFSIAVSAGLLTAADPRYLVTVTGSVTIEGVARSKAANGETVVWLKPTALVGVPPPPRREKIIQRQKRFDPHLLVVPIGSVVDFPNLDPYFHNVFSLFDGKRFDLGLYEAGATRSVTFSRAGVCFVFCNIHPEMSAVVVAVDSPYYAVTGPDGEFRIANVPAGNYLLQVWNARAKAENATALPREVRVLPDSPSIGQIRLVDTGPLIAPHKNKYGRDYDNTPPAVNPVYR